MENKSKLSPQRDVANASLLVVSKHLVIDSNQAGTFCVLTCAARQGNVSGMSLALNEDDGLSGGFLKMSPPC